MFTFRLETLLTLRRRQRDEIRRQSAEPLRAALAEQQRLASELARIGDSLAHAAREAEATVRPGELDIDRLLAGQRYQLTLRMERGRLDQLHRQVGLQVEGFRQRIQAAEQAVRVLEKLRERQAAEYRATEEARETRQLDEVAVLRAARTQRENES